MNDILKDIPTDLWKTAKKKAIDNNQTMKQVLLQLLREWTERKEN